MILRIRTMPRMDERERDANTFLSALAKTLERTKVTKKQGQAVLDSMRIWSESPRYTLDEEIEITSDGLLRLPWEAQIQASELKTIDIGYDDLHVEIIP